ncbi:MAG: hypothetical protein ABI575_06740 [Oxalobacteraceae bacterium]
MTRYTQRNGAAPLLILIFLYWHALRNVACQICQSLMAAAFVEQRFAIAWQQHFAAGTEPERLFTQKAVRLLAVFKILGGKLLIPEGHDGSRFQKMIQVVEMRLSTSIHHQAESPCQHQ